MTQNEFYKLKDLVNWDKELTLLMLALKNANCIKINEGSKEVVIRKSSEDIKFLGIQAAMIEEVEKQCTALLSRIQAIEVKI